MKLFDQFLNGIKFQFRPGTADERYPHGLIINISIKMENMHLNATVQTIIQCRPVTNTQHSCMLRLAEKDINSIHPVGRESACQNRKHGD